MLPAYPPCYDLHESRLAKLEECKADVGAAIKVHEYRLNEFSDRFDEISLKLDANQLETSKTIQDSLKPIHTAIKDVSETLEKGMQRIETLEGHNQKAREAAKAAKEIEETAKADKKKSNDRLKGFFWTAIGALTALVIKDGLPVLLGFWFHK